MRQISENRIFNYVVEILAGIALILLINQLWVSDNFGFSGVSPNPYWIIVVFIAIRYGGIAGFLAGVLCSVVLLLSSVINILSSTSRLWYEIPYKQWELSGLFVIMGFLIGQERTRIEKIAEKLKQRYNRVRSEFENLVVDNLALKKINTELEGRILGQTDTVSTLYDVAKSLTNVKLEDIQATVTTIINRITGSEISAFYVWEGGEYVLKKRSGKNADAKPPKLDMDSDILRLTLAGKKVTTVKDVISAKGMRWEEEKDPPVIVPLFFGEAKETASGLIVLEEISFVRLNPDSMHFLSIMSDWIARSIDNIYQSCYVGLDDIYDRDLGVFRYIYGLRRLREEMLTAKVTGGTLSLMLIKIAGLEGCGEGDEKNGCEQIAEVLKKTCRVSDTLAMGDEKCVLMLILPGSDKTGAEIIQKRLYEKIASCGIKKPGDKERNICIKAAYAVIGPDGAYKSEQDAISHVKKDLLI